MLRPRPSRKKVRGQAFKPPPRPAPVVRGCSAPQLAAEVTHEKNICVRIVPVAGDGVPEFAVTLLRLTNDVEKWRCAGVIAVNHGDGAVSSAVESRCANNEPCDACNATALNRRWS